MICVYDDIDTTFTERSCTPLGEWEVGCYHIPHPIENITKCICDTDLCNGGNEKGIFPGLVLGRRPSTNLCEISRVENY